MKYRITKTDTVGRYTNTITFEAPDRMTVEQQLVWWESRHHADAKPQVQADEAAS